MAIYVPLSPIPFQFVDSNGDPLSSATLSFFLSGTSTPTNLFSDSSGTSIGTSITTNSEGYPESGGNVITLFRDTSIDYKISLDDGSTVWTSDEINSELDVLASVANGEGASLIGVEDSAGNFSGATVEAVLAEIISNLASASTNLGASLIGIEDSAGYFVATTVEAALAELSLKAATKYKTSNESVSSASTGDTLQDDDELTGWALTAGAVYIVEGHISGVSAATPDYKFALTFSNTEQYLSLTIQSTDTSGNVSADSTAASGTVIVIASSGNTDAMDVSGVFKANATTGGTVKLQWAQNTSDASPTQINQGSWLRIMRIS